MSQCDILTTESLSPVGKKGSPRKLKIPPLNSLLSSQS